MTRHEPAKALRDQSAASQSQFGEDDAPISRIGPLPEDFAARIVANFPVPMMPGAAVSPVAASAARVPDRNDPTEAAADGHDADAAQPMTAAAREPSTPSGTLLLEDPVQPDAAVPAPDPVADADDANQGSDTIAGVMGALAPDSLAMIQTLIASTRHEDSAAESRNEPPAPQEPAKQPAPAAPRRQHARAGQDRWAALRDAFAADEAADDDTEEPPASKAGPAPTPIERLRMRQRADAPFAAPKPPVLEDGDITPYDNSVFGGSGTLDPVDLPPAADTLDPQTTPQDVVAPRVWDTPDDHVMSSRGKLAWRLAIFGPILAAPVALLLTSPFAPLDTVKHYVAAAGCTAAGYAGVAPANEGEPGYHARLDPNGNGISCEPDIQRKMVGNGSVSFIRVGDH